MRRIINILIIFTVVLSLNEVKAQSIESKIALKKGNKTYKSGDYDTSLFNYQSSFLYDTSNIDAIYNKGNAALMNGNFEEARSNYNGYLQHTETKIEKADAHYNIGNSYLSEYSLESKNQQQPPNNDLLKSAVEEYKNALRYNFNDEDARYNLSYAMKLLEQNKKDQQNKDEQNKDKQNKDQQNKDEQNKDQQNKDEQNKDQQNKDQQNKDQQKKDQQNKDQKENGKQPQEAQSKQQAMKNLDAINADEQKVLMKVNRKKGDQKKKSKTKDW
ncbi:MAG: hypothetical protein ACJ0QO_03665 [Parvicellaceae bacterium]